MKTSAILSTLLFSTPVVALVALAIMACPDLATAVKLDYIFAVSLGIWLLAKGLRSPVVVSTTVK